MWRIREPDAEILLILDSSATPLQEDVVYVITETVRKIAMQIRWRVIYQRCTSEMRTMRKSIVLYGATECQC